MSKHRQSSGVAFMRPLRQAAWTVLAVVVAGTWLPAQEGAGTLPFPARLTLKECFALALQHNKAIQASRLQAAAERARITQARGNFDPAVFTELSWREGDEPLDAEPKAFGETRLGALSTGIRKRFATGTELEVAGSADRSADSAAEAVFDPSYASGASATLRQDLLRSFGLKANRNGILTAKDTWRMAQEGVRASLIATLFEVEAAYWSLYFAEADLRVREEQLGRASRLVSVAEAQVRVGESAPIEITRARSSAASQQVSILAARSRIPVLRHRLLRQLGVLEPATVERPVELADVPADATAAPTLEESLQTAYDTRPDCRQADLAKTQAERAEAYAANQSLPVLQIYGGLHLAGLDETFDDSRQDVEHAEYQTWMVGARLEVPLGNRTAVGAYRAASLERRRAAAARLAVREQATREVADAFTDLTTAAEQLAATRQSRELAAELLRAEEKSFRIGRSSSLDVLDAQQALAAAEREEVRARVTYATALSGLHVVRGDFLEAKGLAAEAVEGESPE
jgi:outer membrane protein TolC